MIKLDKPIIVEGKYDAIRLANIVDTLIITTEGFGIFKDKEKQAFLRRLASEKGIILLTDSDSAGFLIRSFIKSSVPQDKITHIYIPDIYGKEKRKQKSSCEGKLGVEGIDDSVLLEAFRKAGLICSEVKNTDKREITTSDFYQWGLSGGENSKEKRRLLLKRLALPERMSTSSMIKMLNMFSDYEETEKIIKELNL